jgi:DNA-binding MarR family transcriptional regulator
MPTSKTPSPVAAWLALISVVMDHKGAGHELLEERIGMPWSRFRALRRLEVNSLSQRELADRMSVDAPAMSVIVGDLVRRGLASRATSPDDGRRKIVTITDAGRQLITDVREMTDVVPRLVAGLDAGDRRELVRLVNKMRAGADA